MLRIRLTRVGAKRQPSYRIVVSEISSKRDGRIVERIGFYNPRTDPLTYKIDEGRALHWLSVGAQPSDAVRRLLDKQGTLDRLTRHRKGEALDQLVAEFEGQPLPARVAEAVKDTVREAVGAVLETVGGAVDAAGEALAAETDEAQSAAPDAAEDVAGVEAADAAGPDSHAPVETTDTAAVEPTEAEAAIADSAAEVPAVEETAAELPSAEQTAAPEDMDEEE